MEDIVAQCAAFVRQELSDAEKGHDWWHAERVWKNARLIAASEPVDLLVVELASLLHDIADPKFHDGNEEIGPQRAEAFLRSMEVDPDKIGHIIGIIRNISFAGGNREVAFTSPEMLVVQDADRLDAIGAIGIARAFHYGGFRNRLLYHPDIRPRTGMSKEEYRKYEGPTLNHFYEKLFLLKDRMNTATGRALAGQRHTFMEEFVGRFISEWHGDC